jgi:hypothetical protein
VIINSRDQENDNYSNPLNNCTTENQGKISHWLGGYNHSMPIKDKSLLHILVTATLALQLYLLLILTLSNFDFGIRVSPPAYPQSLQSLGFSLTV